MNREQWQKKRRKYTEVGATVRTSSGKTDNSLNETALAVPEKSVLHGSNAQTNALTSHLEIPNGHERKDSHSGR